MPFNDLEIQKIKNAIQTEFMAKRRPPAEIRAEVDMGFRINNQSIELFEIRPNWQDNTQMMELDFAKITYVKTQKVWKLFWMRQDLKWHSYQPLAQAKQLETLLKEVAKDPNACFFG